MMRQKFLLLLGIAWLCTLAAFAQQTTRYIYDDNGRLHLVISPSNETAIYEYDPAGNIRRISRSGAGAVTITGFTPASGVVGDTVTITGTGFSATATDNLVRFNGRTAVVLSASTTQIVTTVPANARTGFITVSTPNGAAVSGSPFTLGGTLTNVQPRFGKIGTTVTINGTGFEAEPAYNQVRFRQTPAVVTESSATRLVMPVPVGAQTGPVSVTTLNGTLTSPDEFIVTPFDPNLIPVGYVGRMNFGETRTLPFGLGAAAVIVFDATAGQRINFFLAESSANAELTLFTPAGTVVSTASASPAQNKWFAPFAPLTIAQTGTYLLLLAAPQSNPAGSSNLTLTLYNTPTDAMGTIGTDGTPVLVNLAAGQQARLSFTGIAGRQMRLRMRSNSALTNQMVIQRDGAPIGEAPVASGSVNPGQINYLDISALPATGSYTISIQHLEFGAGSLEFRLFDSFNELVDDLVPNGDGRLYNLAASQSMRLFFVGTAGQRVSFKVAAAASLWPITLYQPDGSVLAEATQAVLGQFLDTQTLPLSGTYMIRLARNPHPAIPVTVNLYDVPADLLAQITPDGPPVTVTTITPGQNACLTFTGTSGQRILLTGTGSLDGGAMLSLLKPDGTSLVSPAQISFLDTLTLPTSGSYTIVVDPLAHLTGDLTLRLYNVAPDLTGTIALDGPPITVNNTTPGQNALLTFAGTAGQKINVQTELLSTPGGHRVAVLKPDGSVLSEGLIVDPTNVLSNLTLPDTGTYTLVIDFDRATLGSVRCRLLSPPPENLIVIGGAPVTLTLPDPFLAQEVIFSGSAGQLVSLYTSAINLSQGSLTILKPDGSTLFGPETFFQGGGQSYVIPVLPVTGNYKISVQPSDATGNITLTLRAVPAGATRVNLNAAPQTVPLNIPGTATLYFVTNASYDTTVRLSSNTAGSITVTLKTLDGSVLRTFTSSSGAFDLPASFLSASDRYLITITTNGAGPASGTVNVEVLAVGSES